MDRFGFPSRFWGLTLDNVLGATVVLANGTIVHASDASYPDLFWVSQLDLAITAISQQLVLM